MKDLKEMTLRELVEALEPIGDSQYTERSKAWGELDSRLPEIEAAVELAELGNNYLTAREWLTTTHCAYDLFADAGAAYRAAKEAGRNAD